MASLPAMPQKVIGKHKRNHRLSNRHGADSDARIVPALGLDFGLLALNADSAPPA
jgi:hypothetical protein